MKHQPSKREGIKNLFFFNIPWSTVYCTIYFEPSGIYEIIQKMFFQSARRLSCDAGMRLYPPVSRTAEGGAGQRAALALLAAPGRVRHALLPCHAVRFKAGHAEHPALGPHFISGLRRKNILHKQHQLIPHVPPPPVNGMPDCCLRLCR